MLDHDGNELNIGDLVEHHDLRSTIPPDDHPWQGMVLEGKRIPLCMSANFGPLSHRITKLVGSICVEVEQASRRSNVYLACKLRKVSEEQRAH